MRVTRRQVEHVTGFEHKLFGVVEVLQYLQGHTFLQREIGLLADAPAPPATGLQQKHVVAVIVRPNPAAGAGVGDHQVVQARVRHKTKLLQQLMGSCIVQINTLHEQRPRRFAQRRQAAGRKGTGFHAPAAGALNHKAGLHPLLCGQRKQLGPVQDRLEARDGLAHQQGLFLPMALHELLGRKTAQQGQSLSCIHGTIVG